MSSEGPSDTSTKKNDCGPINAPDSRRNIMEVGDTGNESTGDTPRSQLDGTAVLDSDVQRWLERTGYYDQGRHDAIAKAWKQLDVFDEKAENKLAALDRQRAREAAAIEEERAVLVKKVGTLMSAPPPHPSFPSSKRQPPDDVCGERAAKRQTGYALSGTDLAHHVEAPAGAAPLAFMRPDPAATHETVEPASATGPADCNNPPLKFQIGTSQDTCFFLLKPGKKSRLDLCLENGIWTTRQCLEKKLDTAFGRYKDVIIIFALTQQKIVRGYARMMSRPLPSNATPSWWDGHKDAKSGSASHPFSVQWLGTGKVAYSLFESTICDFQAFQDGQEIPFELGLQILRVIDQNKNGGDGARSSSL